MSEKKVKKIIDLDETDKQANTINSDYKAELVAASLVEQGYDIDRIIIVREGAARRGFAKDIEKIEERQILSSEFQDLSLREIHILETIMEAELSAAKSGHTMCNSATSIAGALHVTPGTMTTAISLLVKKGYVYRKKDNKDRRIIRIYITESGKKALIKHNEFHDEMVAEILSVLSDEEVIVFCRSLKKLRDFFYDKHIKNK